LELLLHLLVVESAACSTYRYPPSRKDTSIANQTQFARRLEEEIAVSYRLADL
jgi:hypothetical protein